MYTLQPIVILITFIHYTDHIHIMNRPLVILLYTVSLYCPKVISQCSNVDTCTDNITKVHKYSGITKGKVLE